MKFAKCKKYMFVKLKCKIFNVLTWTDFQYTDKAEVSQKYLCVCMKEWYTRWTTESKENMTR